MTDDITKHKDWQKWGLIAQNSSLGTVERHTVLELAFREVAPLIFAAGREAEREEARERLRGLLPFNTVDCLIPFSAALNAIGDK